MTVFTIRIAVWDEEKGKQTIRNTSIKLKTKTTVEINARSIKVDRKQRRGEGKDAIATGEGDRLL